MASAYYNTGCTHFYGTELGFVSVSEKYHIAVFDELFELLCISGADKCLACFKGTGNFAGYHGSVNGLYYIDIACICF